MVVSVLVSVYHLPQNLRLAQCHRLQPAADAEQVTRRLVPAQRNRLRQDRCRVDVLFAQQVRPESIHLTRRRNMRVQFEPVAGREDGRFDPRLRA
jgi:hypothetical protein